MQQSSTTRQTFLPRWLRIGVRLTALAFAVLVLIVLTHWPYRQSMVTKSLQSSFSSQISIAQYHMVFFPRPGFVAEGMVFRRKGAENIPPLGTIARLEAVSSYATVFFAPAHFHLLGLTGLRVQIAAAGVGDPGAAPQAKKDKKSSMSVHHLIADNSQLDITPAAGSPPLHFDIHRLRLDNLGATRAMRFSVILNEPLMHSEVQADGRLGPIEPGDPGRTNTDATYKVHGDLSFFHALSGNIAAAGKFSGPLEHVAISGDIATPDFRVEHNHVLNLKTRFNGLVNATDGDITLEQVVAKFNDTTINASGAISGQPKVASLHLMVDQGRIQDLLSIFVEKTPPMSGVVNLASDATLPSSSVPFLKRLEMNGEFGMGGRFTDPSTRHSVDAFSQRAREDKVPKDQPDPPAVVSNLKGHATIRDGIARFSNLAFTVPGASAILSGTFNLLNKRLNLTGDLQMEKDISHATTGIKAVLLKPVAPLFKKKNKTSVMGIQVTGTIQHPEVGPILMSKLR